MKGDCTDCQGSGKLVRKLDRLTFSVFRIDPPTYDCPTCNGTGKTKIQRARNAITSAKETVVEAVSDTVTSLTTPQEEETPETPPKRQRWGDGFYWLF